MTAPTRMVRPIGVAVGVALAVAAAAGCGPWRSAEAPFARDQIKVPHDRHKAAGVECISCHDEIWDEKALGASHLPSEDKCLECHREQKDKGNCSMCHTDVKKAGPWPKRETHLTVSHAAHIERTKEDCGACHKQLPQPLRTTGMTPPMAACLGCHEHKAAFDGGRCDACHEDLSRYPLQPISRYAHQGGYLRRHGADARSSVDSCATCHEQTFCADCHAQTVSTRIELKQSERVDRDFIHRNDFLSRHAMEARLDPATCSRCHGQSFCESCHTVQNLTPRGSNPRDPHPAGWSFPGSADFHGVAARRDISACAACHDQGPNTNCIQCHKVGGVGGNPHPPGFTDRHGHEEIRKNGMCLYCHL